MKLQLIHTESYLVAVDDSEIEDCYALTNSFKSKIIKVDKSNEEQWHQFNCNKITHHLPLNNAPVLENVEILPPFDEAVKLAWKLDLDYNERKAFIKGYNKAKEDYKYTEEDIRMAIQQAFLSGVERLEDFEKVEKMVIENIQGLQPKLPTSFDTETKQYIYATHN